MSAGGDALLIDMGNTRVKWCRCDHAGLGAVHTAAGGVFDPGSLRSTWPAGAAPAAVWLSAVAGQVLIDRVTKGIEGLWGAPLRVVDARDPMPGVRNGYRKPEQLGVDRLLALVAARARTPGPSCVVDCGTAISLDFLGRDGLHRGGFILPGLGMMRSALLDNTHIPRSATVTESDVLGRDTPSAVAMGARYAVVSLIEQFVNGSRTPFPGEQTTLVLGGGSAAQIQPLLSMRPVLVQHLVLEGLARLARREVG